MRSAFSTQEQSFFTNRSMQRVISPNKTYVNGHTQSSFNAHSINGSFNYNSTQNFYEPPQNPNIPNFAIHLPAPKIKQAVTMNDRSIQNMPSVKSPVTFAD